MRAGCPFKVERAPSTATGISAPLALISVVS
jgi:hypothetical protein